MAMALQHHAYCSETTNNTLNSLSFKDASSFRKFALQLNDLTNDFALLHKQGRLYKKLDGKRI